MTNNYFCTKLNGAMNNIKILPIFNQSAPNVWEDFIYIRGLSMDYVYDYHFNVEDYVLALDDFRDTWRHNSMNFAFGAYDGMNMVGFIRGYCNDRTAQIDNLYVLPKYMRHGIGGRLLAAAQRSVIFDADYAELVSLLHAQEFYARNNFTPVSRGSNRFYKTLSRSSLTGGNVVPVFYPNATVARAVRAIAIKNNAEPVDIRKIRAQRTSMFVYLDAESKIRGFGVAGDTDKAPTRIQVDQKYMTRYISMCLGAKLSAVAHLHNNDR